MGHRSSERGWEAEPEALFVRRLGKSPKEISFLDEKGDSIVVTQGKTGCPDFWELSNGDIAVIGRDLTGVYASQLPEGVSIANDERLVVVPRGMVIAAKSDIPDA